MPTIKISELYPIGSELFRDSESFLSELDDGELGAIAGGVKSASITIYRYPSYPISPLCPFPTTTPRPVTPGFPIYTIEPVV